MFFSDSSIPLDSNEVAFPRRQCSVFALFKETLDKAVGLSLLTHGSFDFHPIILIY